MGGITSILEDLSKWVDLKPLFYACLDKSPDFTKNSIRDIQVVMAILWLGHYEFSSDLQMLNKASIYILNILGTSGGKFVTVPAIKLYKKLQSWPEAIVPKRSREVILEEMQSCYIACVNFRSEINLCNTLDDIIDLLKVFLHTKAPQALEIKQFLQGKMIIEEMVILFHSNQDDPKPLSSRRNSQANKSHQSFWAQPHEGTSLSSGKTRSIEEIKPAKPRKCSGCYS